MKNSKKMVIMLAALLAGNGMVASEGVMQSAAPVSWYEQQVNTLATKVGSLVFWAGSKLTGLAKDGSAGLTKDIFLGPRDVLIGENPSIRSTVRRLVGVAVVAGASAALYKLYKKSSKPKPGNNGQSVIINQHIG